MNVVKRDGTSEAFNASKIKIAILKAFTACGYTPQEDTVNDILDSIEIWDEIAIEDIQDQIEEILMDFDFPDVAKAYILYRENRARVRENVREREEFIKEFMRASNAAEGSEVDDNSNVANKNIAVLNNELYKSNNIDLNRYRVKEKLQILYPDFDSKQYERDLKNHILYKHDENSTFGFPYCVALSCYPFLQGGIKGIGGLSASPKNLDSFCGMFVNMIFAVSSQFAGAVATASFLVMFDHFARKKWGDHYFKYADGDNAKHRWHEDENGNKIDEGTIGKQIEQYFQQIVYSVNQPAAARGFQSAFWNVSYFDKPYFEGMYGHFVFPDGDTPKWDSLNWLQKKFMKWFNAERLRCMLTFPVETVSLLYKDGKFEDQEWADFISEEYAEGHSFFTYISDSVDSLSSCCRLKNKLQSNEFTFTNGLVGEQTGSKSVITLNLNRIIQNYIREYKDDCPIPRTQLSPSCYPELGEYLKDILERVYKYHTAYNELLWDLYNAHLLPVYEAGFINLNNQYLTIGLNGLNEAAMFLGIKCSDNKEYKEFCNFIFGTIKEQNQLHNTKKTMFNTELVPAESLAVKNYNWDKADGYWVPKDRNLYTSYVFLPESNSSILEKIKLHGSEYVGDWLDGGSAAHINLSEHPTKNQASLLLNYAATVGCSYLTFNVPNSECQDCGFITKVPVSKCPMCGSTHIDLYDRIIGYLTKIRNWSAGRQEEQTHRVYNHLTYTVDESKLGYTVNE